MQFPLQLLRFWKIPKIAFYISPRVEATSKRRAVLETRENSTTKFLMLSKASQMPLRKTRFSEKKDSSGLGCGGSCTFFSNFARRLHLRSCRSQVRPNYVPRVECTCSQPRSCSRCGDTSMPVFVSRLSRQELRDFARECDFLQQHPWSPLPYNDTKAREGRSPDLHPINSREVRIEQTRPLSRCKL